LIFRKENNKHSAKNVRIQDEDIARRGRLHNGWMDKKAKFHSRNLRRKFLHNLPRKPDREAYLMAHITTVFCHRLGKSQSNEEEKFVSRKGRIFVSSLQSVQVH